MLFILPPKPDTLPTNAKTHRVFFRAVTSALREESLSRSVQRVVRKNSKLTCAESRKPSFCKTGSTGCKFGVEKGQRCKTVHRGMTFTEHTQPMGCLLNTVLKQTHAFVLFMQIFKIPQFGVYRGRAMAMIVDLGWKRGQWCKKPSLTHCGANSAKCTQPIGGLLNTVLKGKSKFALFSPNFSPSASFQQQDTHQDDDTDRAEETPEEASLRAQPAAKKGRKQEE